MMMGLVPKPLPPACRLLFFEFTPSFPAQHFNMGATGQLVREV